LNCAKRLGVSASAVIVQTSPVAIVLPVARRTAVWNAVVLRLPVSVTLVAPCLTMPMNAVASRRVIDTREPVAVASNGSEPAIVAASCCAAESSVSPCTAV
jgi:hypothetical protein